MAFFDWVTKGFTTEKKARGDTDNPVATSEQAVTEPAANPAEKASAVLFNYQAHTNNNQYQNTQAQQGFNSAFHGNTIGNRQILVISPRSDAEVISIVEHLKTNEAVIVNFEGIPVAETQRRRDFLIGVACGLGGVIRPLDQQKFIMTPSGIGVKN